MGQPTCQQQFSAAMAAAPALMRHFEQQADNGCGDRPRCYAAKLKNLPVSTDGTTVTYSSTYLDSLVTSTVYGGIRTPQPTAKKGGCGWTCFWGHVENAAHDVAPWTGDAAAVLGVVSLVATVGVGVCAFTTGGICSLPLAGIAIAATAASAVLQVPGEIDACDHYGNAHSCFQSSLGLGTTVLGIGAAPAILKGADLATANANGILNRVARWIFGVRS